MGQRGQGIIFFSMENEIKLSIRNRMFIHHRIVSAVKRVEFVSDLMLYIVPRGRCVISVFCVCMH